MRSSLARLSAFCIIACSVSLRLMGEVIDVGLRFVFELFRPEARAIADLVRGPSTLAIAGPSSDIDAALYHRNRHEAGLARLGAVRHV